MLMKKFTVRLFVALAVATLGLVSANRALAVTVPINFTGTEQDFDATLDLSGNLYAVGSGNVFNAITKTFQPFVLTAPFNHPLSLAGGAFTVSTDPKTDPLGTTFDISPGAINSTSALNLDFLNGQTADFALDTLVLTTNSKVVLLNVLLGQIDLSGTLSDLRFAQTGASFLTGGGGSGTFSVDGDLGATISNLQLVLGGLLVIGVDDQSVSLPAALSGNWTLSGPTNNTKVSLDGSLSFDVPIALMSNLTTSITDVLSLTISSTIDLAGSLTVSYTFHLEQSGIVIPEPGSMVLMGLGMLAFAPLVVRRIRR